MNVRSLLVISFAILPGISQAELCLIDQGAVVVCGPEQNTVIVDTDSTWKRGLDGRPSALQQQIQQDIIAQQVIADKVPMDPTAADKYVESMKKQNNFTDKDLIELFESVGRTFNEGIKLLSDQYTYEVFMHHKFKSQLVPTEDEIMSYYKTHPEHVDGFAQIQVAYVDFTDETKESIKKNLDKIVTGKKVTKFSVEFSDPVIVKEGDIAEDKRFIFDMKTGQTRVVEGDERFEIYKLLEKQPMRQKSLDECRFSIVDHLNQDRLAEMLGNYNQEIRKFVDVINLDQNIVIQQD